MKDDIRYSEFLFLRDLEKNPLKSINPNDQKEQEYLGLNQVMYIEMVVASLEDLYVQLKRDDLQLLVWQLRGEAPLNPSPSRFGCPRVRKRAALALNSLPAFLVPRCSSFVSLIVDCAESKSCGIY